MRYGILHIVSYAPEGAFFWMTTILIRPQPVSETEDLDGRYRLDEKIGEGGSGRVYRAHDLLLDTQIAIKLLHPALYRNAQALGDLQSEARICRTLAHPNIVRLYNLDKRGGHYLLVMEYIDGPNLHTLLKIYPTPEPALFRSVIEAIAAALDEAHRRRVCRRARANLKEAA
jgi:serine/threonine protein kinase